MKKDVLNAVRAKCLDCCMGQANEVKLCTIADCSLYPFRFGKDPFVEKREMSEKQRLAIAENAKKLALWREQNKTNG